MARGRLLAQNSSPAADCPRRRRRGHLARKAGAGPQPPRPSSSFPRPGRPQCSPARLHASAQGSNPGSTKAKANFSAAPSSPASILAPRRHVASGGPTRTTHLLAGTGLALGRSPEEGGPGGEKEVLRVLLQAAVATAHAAGPVTRGPPPRGAGGQAGGAAPARPARFPARGPEPLAGRPSAAATAAQSCRPGPSRRLPVGLQARLGPRRARPLRRPGPRPRPARPSRGGSGHAPARPQVGAGSPPLLTRCFLLQLW